MFPPNLQKNIRELDRQISLLETECENMDATDKKNFGRNKVAVPRKSPKKSFLTEHNRSGGSHETKTLNSCSVPVVLKTDSSTVTETHRDIRSTENCDCRDRTPMSRMMSQHPNAVPCKPSEEPEPFSAPEPINKQIVHKEVLITNPGETIEVTVTQKTKSTGRQDGNERRVFNKVLNGSIRKTTESSDDNSEASNKNNQSKSQSKTPACPYDAKNCLGDGNSEKRSKNKQHRVERDEVKGAMSRHTSSDEDCDGDPNRLDRGSHDPRPTENKTMGRNEHSVSVDSVSVKKNWRPRSMRTRAKKTENEVPLDVNMTKVLKEKEIQCVLREEEKEKEEFFVNLNSSIKTLQFLTNKLNKKSSQEKRNDVLHDVQDTMKKIDREKWANIVKGIPNPTRPSQLPNSGFREEKDNVIDLKKAFVAVKQFCEQLSEEKSFLTEEIALRNRIIAGMKSKEKEYLSVISSLKFDSEMAKKQSEEWERTKKELLVCKTKLAEETKVIEGLKKSHAKMQDLVESYVLDNDRLRTQVKIAKLESKKYNVLLASKEEEIKKYQMEIEAFQRQICEQLRLLRSKASENQLDNAIKAIADHTSFISQTEIESLRSEINDLSERLSQISSKTSLGSSWSRQTPESAREEIARAEKEATGSGNEGGYTSCKSNEFETCDKSRTGDTVRNFKRVRSNTDQKLKEAKAKRFHKVSSAPKKPLDGPQRKTCPSTSTNTS